MLRLAACASVWKAHHRERQHDMAPLCPAQRLEGTMQLSRRDLFKVGLFGTAALMLPAERVARTQLAIANRMPQSRLPRPFTVPWATPPVLSPVAQSADTDFYVLNQVQSSVEILPGLRTDIWGYNGITPGPTIVNTQGRKAVVRQICAL